MIDDINTSDTEIWKYVDRRYNYCRACGQELSEHDLIQDPVNELVAMSDENKFLLNESKCKEMRISFAKTKADFAPIIINEKPIEVAVQCQAAWLEYLR